MATFIETFLHVRHCKNFIFITLYNLPINIWGGLCYLHFTGGKTGRNAFCNLPRITQWQSWDGLSDLSDSRAHILNPI